MGKHSDRALGILVDRLEKFVDVSRYFDLEKVVNELQTRHKEYTRWKRNPLSQLVYQAYGCLLQRQGAQIPTQTLNDNDDDSDAIYDGLVAYADENHMNNSLTALYKKQQKSTADNSSSTTEEPNFFIDKSGSGPVAPIDSPDDVQIVSDDEPTASKSGTTSSRKRKRRSPNTATQPTEKTPSTSTKKRTSQIDPIQLTLSTVTFADIGGCEEALLEICTLLTHITQPLIYSTLGISPPRGFLLHGPPGCGKTLVATAIAGEFSLPLIRCVATELVAGVSGESEQRLRELFAGARSNAPCVLFIDEIDAITPKRELAQREMERRIVAQLLACLDELAEDPSAARVLVVGATSRPDALDPGLRRAGRFDREIALGIPDERARAKIIGVLARNVRVSEDVNFVTLAKNTPGFVAADLASLLQEACACAIDRLFATEQTDTQLSLEDRLARAVAWLKAPPVAETLASMKSACVESADFTRALARVQPSSKREGFLTVPDVSWADIGALSAVRRELEWTVLKPIREHSRFESFGLGGRPQGILLCGPPGCGKTLLAKAIANETGMNFVSVKGPELLSMYVGESERAVRQVFGRARNSAPCVIFFDEIDALCPRRAQHDSGGAVRVVNQLLTEMDGIEARKQVFLIGATNRPDIIDPAILRPGRLDKIIYVGFPSAVDRADILRALSRGGTRPLFAADVRLDELAEDERVAWFTGADLAALLREASIEALKEQLQSVDGGEGNGAGVVARRHFELALKRLVGSVDDKERAKFEELRVKYER